MQLEPALLKQHNFTERIWYINNKQFHQPPTIDFAFSFFKLTTIYWLALALISLRSRVSCCRRFHCIRPRGWKVVWRTNSKNLHLLHWPHTSSSSSPLCVVAVCICFLAMSCVCLIECSFRMWVCDAVIAWMVWCVCCVALRFIAHDDLRYFLGHV